MPQSWSTIEVVERGAAAWVRFDRPERRNASTAAMVEEVHAALTSLAPREDLRVVVLTGNGPTFCPGADLQRDPGTPPNLPDPAAYGAARLLVEMPQVTVAAVNGGCAGAGVAWAGACDLRVASERARFALAFLEVGVAGEMGAAWTLRRILGSARARELFLLPRKLTAAEALDLGLVSRVHPADDFERAVDELVAELCGRDPQALRDIKANLVDADRLGLGDYLERETARHVARFTGAAGAETMARFAQRGGEISSGAGPGSSGSPS